MTVYNAGPETAGATLPNQRSIIVYEKPYDVVGQPPPFLFFEPAVGCSAYSEFSEYIPGVPGGGITLLNSYHFDSIAPGESRTCTYRMSSCRPREIALRPIGVFIRQTTTISTQITTASTTRSSPPLLRLPSLSPRVGHQLADSVSRSAVCCGSRAQSRTTVVSSHLTEHLAAPWSKPQIVKQAGSTLASQRFDSRRFQMGALVAAACTLSASSCRPSREPAPR